MTKLNNDGDVIAVLKAAQETLVPADGPSRPIVRLRHILAGAYDYDTPFGEPEQSIIDLLTDVLHWCDQESVDLADAMEAAERMRAAELDEWERTGQK